MTIQIQVYARGTKVFSGALRLLSTQESSFSIPITDKMTPHITVIASHETTEGYLISDSAVIYVNGSVFQNEVRL